jgi:glutamate racemase
VAILIACCSASTVYHRLNEKEREIALPIISPSARLAAEGGRRITVIATRHTASSGAFSREIGRFSDATVCKMAEQGLVALVESGNRDGRVRENCKTYLTAMTERIKESDADTLILGCTHFSHLERELQERCNITTVSPAREGAIALVNGITKSRTECGRSIYI